MIVVLISALIAGGTVTGDTLSTVGLAAQAQRFYAPPAVLLDGGMNWQTGAAPVIFAPFYFDYGRGQWRRGHNDVTGPHQASGGVKRSDEGLRQKK